MRKVTQPSTSAPIAVSTRPIGKVSHGDQPCATAR